VFYGGLRHVYSGVARVNRGNTPESGWIHLKVGIQCVLFLEGALHEDNSKGLL